MTQTTVHSAEAATRPTLFLDDLVAGLRQSDVWRAFAWDETQHRYRRSFFGVLWILISYIIFVSGISFFFGGFAVMETKPFIMYVALGYASYRFVIGNVTDGCQVFASSANWIKSSTLPYSIYVYKSIARSVFPYSLELCVAFTTMVALGWRPTWLALLAVPALVIYIVTAVGVQYFLGLVGARFRDITHLVSAITRLTIFITPILWVREERTGVRAVIADVNPLTHFIEIFRSPLLGTEPRLLSWTIVLGVTAAVWVAAAAASARMRRRLAFWV